MSTHPFFVDQTPYLPVASSSKSKSQSKSTIYTNSSLYSVYSESNLNTHSRTCSSTSINTLASEASTSSTTSTSSTSSSFSRSTPINRECLRWMQVESDSDHVFGSVASRGKSISSEERDVRRRAMEVEEAKLAVVEITEECKLKAIKAERRKGKVGKWF